MMGLGVWDAPWWILPALQTRKKVWPLIEHSTAGLEQPCRFVLLVPAVVLQESGTQEGEEVRHCIQLSYWILVLLGSLS